MSKIKKLLAGVVVVGLAVGAVVLLTVDIPAPESKVTKTISNDRFPS